MTSSSRRVFIAACLVAVPTVAAAQSTLRPQDIAARARPALVSVSALDRAGNTVHSGSGFFVDGIGTVVTSLHVVEGAMDVHITTADGQTYRDVDYVAADVMKDLLVLRIARPSTSSLRLADPSARPSIGDAVFVFGNPLGLEASFSDGLISAFRTSQDANLIQISAPISSGSSGGPVLSVSGLVIGVVTATIREGQNLNLAVSSSHLAPLLRAATGSDGVRFRDVAPIGGAVLTEFWGVPWGSSASDVQAVMGTADQVDRSPLGSDMYTYSRDAYGPIPAQVTFYTDGRRGLHLGRVLVRGVPLRYCVSLFEAIRDRITDDLGVAPSETLNRPPTGNLCSQIEQGSAEWSITWRLVGGLVIATVSNVPVTEPPSVGFLILYTTID